MKSQKRSLKSFSAKAAALLQLCRDGKGEHYGAQLAELTICSSDSNFFFEVKGLHKLQPEIEAYHFIALQYQVRTALERWRQSRDEMDAEIVFHGYKRLEQELSHAELHAIWYDCSSKMARDMLEAMNAECDADELSDLLHKLRLLTLDIPTETGRSFPYERVFLAWPGGGDEETLRAHVQSNLAKMVSLYRAGSYADAERLSDSPDVLSEHMYSTLWLRINEWKFSYGDLALAEEEVAQLVKRTPPWRTL